MTSRPTLVLAMVLALPVLAAQETPVSTAQADVDGDGKPEQVTLKPEGPKGFLLTVGSVQVRSSLEGGAKGFTLMDLDGSDARREVLVHGQGKAPGYLLFRWHKGALQPLPLPPGRPSASGNGILLADVSRGFWEQRHKYLYDASKPGFTEVPQPLYYVGKVLEPTQPVALQLSRDSATTVAQVGQGGSAVLLGYSPDPKAPGDVERGWYLLKARGGVLGWAQRAALGAQPRVSPLTRQLSPPREDRSVKASTRVTGDLDGDGKEEDISMTLVPDEKQPEEEQAPETEPQWRDPDEPACLRWEGTSYQLSIGSRPGAKVVVDACSDLEGVVIVDIDTADRRKELLVLSFNGLEMRYEGSLFRGEGKKLQLSEIELPSMLVLGGEANPFRGEGTHWIWSSSHGVRLFRYDGQAFIHIPQEWRFVEEGGTRQTEKSFPLRYEPKQDAAVVANVKPGSTILLMAEYTPSPERPPRNDPQWYLVRSETGLVGWAMGPDVSGLKEVDEDSGSQR